MSETKNTKLDFQNGSNAKVAVLCLSLVAGMGGLAFASVPLYKLFCQVTGYGGTTQRVASIEGVKKSDKEISVRFDANVATDLIWDFKPVERSVNMKLGEQVQISYVAKNTSNVPMTGKATFNVSPQSAGAYFNKMECFCFTETTLQPGETLDMPVVFFIDPEISDEYETKNIKSVTLSYTFHQIEPAQKPVAKLENKSPVNLSSDNL